MTAPVGVPEEVDAVILDVDGTLLDTNELHTVAWARALRRHGHVVPMAEIHRAIGMGGTELLRSLAGAPDPEIEEDWKREYARFLDEIVPLPGARDLLVALRDAGLALALATSGAPEFLARTNEVLDLDTLEVEVVSSGEVEQAKPAPDLFAVAAERLGVPPARCLAVGDTVWDVAAANAAGIACVGLTSGGTSARELEDAGAVRTCADPADLHAQWPFPGRRRAA